MPFNTLSTTKADAIKEFNNLLSDRNRCVVVVFGNDQTGRDAKRVARELDDTNLPDYLVTNFVACTDIDDIMDVIQRLPDKKDVLTRINKNDHVALSITKQNQLVYLVSKAQFNNANGFIKTAVFKALGG
jgi:hypothetical protein